jgi:hypothetical protein
MISFQIRQFFKLLVTVDGTVRKPLLAFSYVLICLSFLIPSVTYKYMDEVFQLGTKEYSIY